MSLVRFRLGRLFPVVALVTLATVTGCVSTTLLQTQPTGARVIVNGVPMGTTPYTLADTNVVTTVTRLRFEYPGYQPLDATIARDEEIDPVPLVVGIIVWPVLLWVLRYHPTHLFVLEPANGAPVPDAWGAQQQQQQQQPAPGPAGYPAPPPGYPPPAPEPPAGYPPPPPAYPPPQ